MKKTKGRKEREMKDEIGSSVRPPQPVPLFLRSKQIGKTKGYHESKGNLEGTPSGRTGAPTRHSVCPCVLQSRKK
jgi:hypothetical protein